MKRLIEKMNTKLLKHSLILDEERVLNEYARVEQAWTDIINQAHTPVKFLIIGEATRTYGNYFYNLNSDETSFLRPNQFDCKTKPELIDLFQANGVLVFDLYPLPLPTFIYDNVSFDCNDPEYEKLLIEYYSDKLSGLIDQNTRIVLRYIKLSERPEWKLFINFLENRGVTVTEVIENGNTRPLNISGSISADKTKIRDIFNSIIP